MESSIASHVKILCRFLLVAVFFLVSCQSAMAEIKTDNANYPLPALPALPAAGGIMIDSTFGTGIMRITDANDGVECINNYSYWPSFNKNSTWLLAHCLVQVSTYQEGRNIFYRWDPVNFAIIFKKTLSTPEVNLRDGIWSGVDPNVMFGFGAGKLYAVNIETGTSTVVKDFSALFPDENQYQFHKSLDDNVFSFTRKRNVDYDVTGYAVWKRDTDEILYNADTLIIDEVQIDKSGRYLIVKTGESGAGVVEGKIVDLQTNTVTNLLDGAPDYNIGHSDNGYGVQVGFENWDGKLWKRNLAAPAERVDLFPNAGYGDPIASIGGHYSMLMDGDEWVLVSSIEGSPGPLQDEIFLLATDGSARVKRLAHHRSVYSSYYDYPRANISRDGKFVAFTSNWGNSGRRDVFVATTYELDVSTPSDTTAPTISLVAVSGVTQSAATITWTTNEASDTQVLYGTTSSLGSTTAIANTSSRVTSHSVTLSSLTAGTTYHYRVRSSDASGNVSLSSIATFTTTAASSGGGGGGGSGSTSKQPYKFKVAASTLEGYSSIAVYPTVTVEVINQSTKAVLSTQSLTADSAGVYTATFSSTDPDTVGLRIKIAGFLPKMLTNVSTITDTTATPTTVPTLPAGDFNGDGMINSLDHSSLNRKWNQTISIAALDINRDGTINSLDYAILGKNWGVRGE